MTPDDMKKRTKVFALRIIRLAQTLPRTAAAATIGGQLVKCGTSVGANYRSACKGRSKADFIAKLGIAEEEADESVYWLEVLVEAKIVKSERVAGLITEATELTAIIGASRVTAKRNSESTRPGRQLPHS
jgi:four helix bundle protein